MKKRVHAKIGTHGSTEFVLWNDKEIKKGDRVLGMEGSLYDSLHSSHRRWKSCQYWKEYYVDDIEPILFLSK